MKLFRILIAALLPVLLATQVAIAQDEKPKKRDKKKKKAKTEQPANAVPDQEISDTHPTISKRDLETSESMFVEGVKQFMLENYPRAIDQFQKSIAINPHNAAVYFKLAESHLAMGNAKAALPAAQKALSIDKKNRYYYLMLAQIYANQQQYDDAVKVFTQLVKEVPDSEQYYLQLADLYVAQNKLDEALKAYEKLEKSIGVFEELSFKKQQIYLRQNNLTKAIAEGEKLIESNPDEPRYLLAQAQLLASNNKMDQAFTMLSRAVKVDPENAYAQMLLAEMLRTQGKEKEANEQLKLAFRNPSLDIDSKVKVLVDLMRQLNNPEVRAQALDLAEITVSAHPTEAKAFAVAGDLQAIAGKKEQARQNYLKAARIDNSHFQIWQQIILLDAELQQTDSLLAHTETALELFPNQAIFWFYNGTANMLKNNHSKAVRALEQGRKLSANNPELEAQFSAQLGDAYNSLKEYAKSDAAYEAALKHDANNAHVLNNYSYFLSLRNQNLDKAKAMSQKLVDRHPTDDTYLDTHAWVLYKQKDYQGALKYLEMAVAKTKSGTVVEHYGDVLYQLGQKEKALEQWRRAKELGNASDLIDKKLKDKKLYE